MEGATSQLAGRIRLDGGGYHRPVCIETVVGPFHHFRWRGGADNNNNNNLFFDFFLGRTYDARILDMVEFGIVNYKSLPVLKVHVC